MKDGVYKSYTAIYFVKDGKIIMRHNGDFFKNLSTSLPESDWEKPLDAYMNRMFEKTYSRLTQTW